MRELENLKDCQVIYLDIGAGALIKKNRIVYRIYNNSIQIIQCGSHYRDK